MPVEPAAQIIEPAGRRRLQHLDPAQRTSSAADPRKPGIAGVVMASRQGHRHRRRQPGAKPQPCPRAKPGRRALVRNRYPDQRWKRRGFIGRKSQPDRLARREIFDPLYPGSELGDDRRTHARRRHPFAPPPDQQQTQRRRTGKSGDRASDPPPSENRRKQRKPAREAGEGSPPQRVGKGEPRRNAKPKTDHEPQRKLLPLLLQKGFNRTKRAIDAQSPAPSIALWQRGNVHVRGPCPCDPAGTAERKARVSASKVVTRFAPSPTGYLHIGGARTALFNWLFARHHGGEYLLRIEDTDRSRSTKEAIDAILDGLAWLDIAGDGEPHFQSEFEARHAEVAHQLLESGHAYRCYLSPDELASRRERAQAERRPFRIDSEWRDCADAAPEGTPFVVRIKAPREGETAIDDLVQGHVTVANSELDDFVLLRSDGTPTYMLAVVVDDHDMGVTHIIRGDDHLNNAFRQLAIIRAMGWPEPTYAHIPLIHGQDGAKLSKRHGALGVDAYRDELGILPEALFNYLLRLGWGHGDDEIIDRAQAVEWFDLDHVGKSPSRFDLKKLESLNGHYLRHADDARLSVLVAGRRGGLVGEELALLERAMPELKARAKDLNELAAAADFLFAARPLEVEPGAAALLTDDARRILVRAHSALAGLTEWTKDSTEAAVREVAEEAGLKLGKLAQPLRAALTGKTTSPGIFDVLALLGQGESLGRIEDQMRAKTEQMEQY